MLTLRTFVGFLAKNDRPDVLPAPIKIPSMFNLVGRCEPERFWCPVRAVDIYLSRTQGNEYSPEDTRLLRHPSPKITTTKGHVAFWIRNTVTLAYEAAGRGGKTLTSMPTRSEPSLTRSLTTEALHSRRSWMAGGGVAVNPSFVTTFGT